MNNHPALNWWGNLSINEQKEVSKKHLLPYQYAYIWDYGYSKHVSPQLYLNLRIKIWESEGKPKINLVGI